VVAPLHYWGCVEGRIIPLQLWMPMVALSS